MRFLFSYQKRRLRIVILCVLVLLLAAGLYSKYYQGPYYYWVRNYCGDIVFVMFFYFLLKLFRPYVNSLLWGGVLFVFMIGIEFSQELRWRILDHVRSTFIGQILIGEYFDPRDLIYYLIGVAGGVAGFEAIYRMVRGGNAEKTRLVRACQMSMDFDPVGTSPRQSLSKQ